MTLLTALIGQTIKLRWKLSLQVRGRWPGAPDRDRLLRSEGAEGEPARIRAYASYDAERLDRTLRSRSRRSARDISRSCSIRATARSRTRGSRRLPVARLRPVPRPISRNPNSLPTRFRCPSGRLPFRVEPMHWRGGRCDAAGRCRRRRRLRHRKAAAARTGLLEAADILGRRRRAENWNHVNVLLDTAEDIELIGPTVQPTDLLVRLFHEDAPRVFDASAVSSAAPVRRTGCGNRCRSIRPKTLRT